MPAVAMFLVKLCGLGKTLMTGIWGIMGKILRFAINKPFQFLTILFALSLVVTGWIAHQTSQELTKTQKVVTQKVLIIKEQDRSLKSYVKALDVEKTNHVRDIKRSNDAVDDIKKIADGALARAQAASEKALRDKTHYDSMAADYGRANPSTGTAEQRIIREQQTNDRFIEDWRKAQ